MSEITLTRYRIHHARGAELRYVGNLDMQMSWERCLRRARLPVAFSQGFNARPRFHLAAALPLGFTSRAEILDLWLNEALEADEVGMRLKTAAPPGLLIDTIEIIPLNLPALQTQVGSAEYIAVLREVPEGLDIPKAVEDLLNESTLPRERRGKPYDLRPLVYSLQVLPSNTHGQPVLKMHLSAREGATARPEEVLSALSIDPTTARVERIQLLMDVQEEPAAPEDTSLP